MMKQNNFRGELTDVSAEKDALVLLSGISAKSVCAKDRGVNTFRDVTNSEV